MRLLERSRFVRRDTEHDVLPVMYPRGSNYWIEPEGYTATAMWLGGFPLTEPYRCVTRCGAMAIARATWIYRGKILALELCLSCCQIARDHKHPCLSIQPPCRDHEQRPTRSPDKPRGWKWRNNKP